MSEKMQNNSPVRILGIDPGYDRLGLAVIEIAGGKDALVASTCVVTSRKNSPAERLLAIGKTVREFLEEFEPHLLVMESLFFANNKNTALGVAEARGVVMYLAAQKNIPCFEMTPPEIKLAVAGSGRADKAAVEKMVRLLVKLPEKKQKEKYLDDEIDAIAVALSGRSKVREVFHNK